MSAKDGNEPPDENSQEEGRTNGNPPKLMKKSSSMYLNVRMPHRPDRPHIMSQEEEDSNFYTYGDASYDPADKVQMLLRDVRDAKHRTRHLFVEMDVLTHRGEEAEWREWARWVKYEEKVEDGGKRWSKPHVASLNMHYLMEIRKQLLEGVFLPDMECYTIAQAVEQLLDSWISKRLLDPTMRQYVRTLCLKNHRHRHEKGRPEDKKKNGRQFGDAKSPSGANLSVPGTHLTSVASAVSLSSTMGGDIDLEDYEPEDKNKQQNARFLRKIPKGSEVANVMVAQMDELNTILCGLVRLNDARIIGDLSEVNLPTRFVFFLLGPKGSLSTNQESGRCLATMLVDEVFREVAYKARNCDDIVAGIDEFLEQVTVLPPGEWDPKIRIEPPDTVPDQKFRRIPTKVLLADAAVESEHGGESPEEEGHCDPDLVFSGKPFGGLINDIKRKIPFYWSDYKDVLHIQCLASFIYIFLATLTPNVTFGGMLGEATDQYMGVMECIFAAAVTGIIFALFSGQPLNILGSTGPMLVLEKIIYELCKDNEWEFLPFRFWIGIWTSGMLLLIVAFDLSALVRYITRFTEESFASLIAFIFIYEAFKKLGEIAQKDAPMRLDPDGPEMPNCFCNITMASWSTHNSNSTVATTLPPSLMNVNETMCNMYNGSLTDGSYIWECDPLFYVPDVFLISIMLFIITFCTALFLVDFRTWPCFPTFVRTILGDFSVLIAIVLAVGIDLALGLPTPKLTVPDEFKPTRSDVRDWLVNPVAGSNPWWLALAGGIPALLATILIFMDQQITAVIVNRKENKLAKGKGYHLDLLVLAILVAVHSLLGLPWYVAATVSAIAHINSLKKQSECTAPGERPSFLGVREQRVTALLVGIFSGASVFITNILKVIPMPVLYGVFFYMGWSALRGMQFIDRIMLMFMPVKYQPDHVYLRHVPLWRVHIFTLIQVLCLAALWVVKSIKSISIVFPLLVLFTGVVRKILECNYSQNELKYLDDLLPTSKKNKKDDEKELESDKKISSIIANADTFFKPNGVNGKSEGEKASFFLNDEGPDLPPPAYDNKGLDTKM